MALSVVVVAYVVIGPPCRRRPPIKSDRSGPVEVAPTVEKRGCCHGIVSTSSGDLRTPSVNQ